MEDLIDRERFIIEKNPKVVLKQFNLKIDKDGFLKELVVLKKIK